MNRSSRAFFWLIGLLIVAGLACAQAGEVLTPAEATERAVSAQPTYEPGDVANTIVDIGDQATLTGRSVIVNVLNEPGGRIVAGQERGATITVLNIVEDENGDRWYQIEGSSATGWVGADNIEPLEGEEGQTGTDEGGIASGDTVYLTGRGFLINIYNEPGPNTRLIANQERGVAVTVLGSTNVEGTLWYRIEAPTGEGWVAAENVTTEAP